MVVVASAVDEEDMEVALVVAVVTLEVEVEVVTEALRRVAMAGLHRKPLLPRIRSPTLRRVVENVALSSSSAT